MPGLLYDSSDDREVKWLRNQTIDSTKRAETISSFS